MFRCAWVRTLGGFVALGFVLGGLTMTALPAGAAGTKGGAEIFQVEFRRCDGLHVGYQNFPARTVVHYHVTQFGLDVANGQFVTRAGAGYHFLTARLPAVLSRESKASVTFTANVKGHAYQSSAGRTAADPRKNDCPTQPVTQKGGRDPVVTKRPVPKRAVAQPARPLRSLALTGNGSSAFFGVGFLAAGGALLLGVRLVPARPKRKRRRRGDPWLYVTNRP